MAEQIQAYLHDEQMPVWKTRYAGVEDTGKSPVMGCVVNGPGESKHSNIGISLPGTFEEPKAPYRRWTSDAWRLKNGDHIVAEFIKIVDNYVDSHYAAKEQLVQDQQLASGYSRLAAWQLALAMQRTGSGRPERLRLQPCRCVLPLSSRIPFRGEGTCGRTTLRTQCHRHEIA